MSATATPRRTRIGFTVSGRRRTGRTLSARIAPPTGSVAAPEKATTPFMPTRPPGVVRPCSTSSAAMTQNALPTSTARPSRRRAPTMVSAAADTVATKAPIATPQKCTPPPKYTFSRPTKWSSAGGTHATKAASANMGTRRSLILGAYRHERPALERPKAPDFGAGDARANRHRRDRGRPGGAVRQPPPHAGGTRARRPRARRDRGLVAPPALGRLLPQHAEVHAAAPRLRVRRLGTRGVLLTGRDDRLPGRLRRVVLSAGANRGR